VVFQLFPQLETHFWQLGCNQTSIDCRTREEHALGNRVRVILSFGWSSGSSLNLKSRIGCRTAKGALYILFSFLQRQLAVKFSFPTPFLAEGRDGKCRIVQ
jgi:hypothetical protein